MLRREGNGEGSGAGAVGTVFACCEDAADEGEILVFFVVRIGWFDVAVRLRGGGMGLYCCGCHFGVCCVVVYAGNIEVASMRWETRR